MNNYIKVFKKVFMLVVFLLASASLYSQDTIRNAQDFADMVPNGSYILMYDITVTQMYTQIFSGQFNGNNKKITVNINENVTNVGLFSQVAGAHIGELTIDGYVVGGIQSENVGGFVGLIFTQQYLSDFANCTNLADVTGESHTSSVGGLVGATNGHIMFLECANNGIITGGEYVGGIIGSCISNSSHTIFHNSKNAGTIQGICENQHSMGGVIGYAYSSEMRATNIGRIFSNNSLYAGGLAGYIEVASIYLSINSGIVAGAIFSVGGIAGYINNQYLDGCINTNWVDSGTAMHFGAIVGLSNIVSFTDCYYDNQMCVIGAVDNRDVPGTEGRPTLLMIGRNLPIWYAQQNPYPQLYPSENTVSYVVPHPIDLLAAAPIYPDPNPNIANMTQDFKVSNDYPVPPFLQLPYSHPYIWRSVNGFINIPANSDDAFINPPFGILRQDTLRVILPGEPYVKDIPMWLR